MDTLTIQSQAMVQSWWHHHPDIGIPSPVILEGKDANILFALLIGLLRGITYIRGRFSLFHRPDLCEGLPISSLRTSLSPRVNLTVTATAFKALADWPNGLYEFLESYRNRYEYVSQRKVMPDFGMFFTRIIEKYWKHPDFQFIQNVFNEYLANTYGLTATVTQLGRYRDKQLQLKDSLNEITLAEASRLLGVSEKTVAKYVARGSLQVIESSGGGDRYVLFDRKSVDEFATLCKRERTLNEAAKELGTSKRVINQLLQRGLLQNLPHVLPSDNSSQVIDSHSIDALKQQLKSTVRFDYDIAQVISLRSAAQILSRYKTNTADIIVHVLDGHLAAYWKKPLISDLLINRDDLFEVRTELFESRSKLSLNQVAKSVHMKPASVKKWIESGLISAEQHSDGSFWISAADWEDFRNQYLFTEEAAELLRVTVLTVQKWIRRGRLQVIRDVESNGLHRYLLPRDGVERLLPNNQLSIPQIKRLYKLGREKVMALTAQGRLSPISGPGVDGYKHYLYLRSDIESLALEGAS